MLNPFFLAVQFLVQDLIVELCRMCAGGKASCGTMMAFCPDLIRSVESKSLPEYVHRFNSVLVEVKVMCKADVKNSVTQDLVLNKKLPRFRCPSESVSYMIDIENMSQGIDGRQKAPVLKNNTRLPTVLVIRSLYNFDF